MKNKHEYFMKIIRATFRSKFLNNLSFTKLADSLRVRDSLLFKQIVALYIVRAIQPI